MKTGKHVMRSVSPSDYRVVGEVEMSRPEEIHRKVILAKVAAANWAGIGISERVAILRRALIEFEHRQGEVVRLETEEMGKPITAAISDFGDAVAFYNGSLDNAGQYLATETTLDDDKQVDRVFREPLGVAAVIIPWNYPFLMFVWTVIPNLLAGNTVVLKHSEECPLVGKLIEEVMTRHLPASVFAEVYGDGKTGEKLMNEDINLVCFTGSARTGRRLYELAGKKFIRAVMELGGSAPGIIFKDADIDAAVKSVCFYRLTNAGQYCDGLKRLIVHRSVYAEVVAKLRAAFRKVEIGSPEDPATEMGPLVAKRQLELLDAQVNNALRLGAQATSGGFSLENELGGAFYAPTLLTTVTEKMRVWKEEVFGPVLPVVQFHNDLEAINLANDTEYGLGGYVYTADRERADRIAKHLETGMVSINGANYTAPHNPFGGWKHSGMGREHGKWGFHDLTQVKVVARPK